MQRTLNDFGQPIGFPVPYWKSPEAPPRAPMEGHFCRLDPLNPPLHAASLHSANSMDADGRMWTYLPYGPFDSLDSYRAWTDEMSRRTDPLFFAIIDRATGRAVGLSSYLRIDPAAGSIEVGHLNYSPLLQRTPAATEAMFLMMERAFHLGYRRYEWKCDALNAPSRAAALRLGLSYEGIFRQHMVLKQRSRDSAWFAATDHEWPALDTAFRRWLDPANFDAEGRQRIRLSALTAPLLARRE